MSKHEGDYICGNKRRIKKNCSDKNNKHCDEKSSIFDEIDAGMLGVMFIHFGVRRSL